MLDADPPPSDPPGSFRRARGMLSVFRQLVAPGARTNLRTELISQGAQTTALNLASMALSFLITLVLTRELGARGYGSYVYALTWPMLLAVASQVGYGQLLVRNIAAYVVRGEWGLIRGIVQRSQRMLLAISGGLVVAVGALGWAFVGHRQPDVRRSFFIALLLVPLLALMAHREAVLRGYRRVALGRLPETTIQPSLILVLVGAGYVVLGRGAKPPEVMAVTVIATTVAVIVGTLFVVRVTPPEVRAATPESDRAAWAGSARSLVAIGGLQVVNLQMAVLLLGALKTVDETAMFNAALRWASMVTFLQAAATFPLAPALAGLHVSGSRARTQRLVSRASVTLLVLAVPVVLALLLFGEAALGLFGDRFTSGTTALRILVIGEFINIGSGLAGIILVNSGQERVLFTAVAWLTVGKLALSATLISLIGLEGAAIGQAIGITAQSVVLAVIVWRRLGIYAPAIGRRLVSAFQ